MTPLRSMRPAKIDWLEGLSLPSDWSESKVKYVAPGMRAGEAITAESIEPVGTYPVYGGNGLRGYTEAKTHHGTRILIGRQGALCGNVHLVSGEFWASEHAIVARAADVVDSRWLTYLLRVMNLGQYSQTAAQPGIGTGQINALPVPVPPLSEQRDIADYLDRETARIDTLIEEQQRLIEMLRERRRIVLVEATCRGISSSATLESSGVGWIGAIPSHWEIVAIKWLTPVKRGASPRPIDDPIYFDDDGEWAWVRIADVSSAGVSGVLRSTSQTLSELGSSRSVKIEPGELFVSIAATVGKPCITGIKCCIHDGFVYFPDLRIDPWWLFRVFEAGECYRGLGKMGTQLNLNTDTIGGIKVPVPPRDEIQQILAYLEEQTEKIDTLIGEAEVFIELSKERRSALITAAVTGQIDVRELA